MTRPGERDKELQRDDPRLEGTERVDFESEAKYWDAQSDEETDRSMSRRRFLEMAAMAGLGTAALGGMVSLTDMAARASSGDSAPAGNVATKVKDKEVAEHQWVYLIDLRLCDGCEKCLKACQEMHHLPEEQTWIKINEMESASGDSFFMPTLCMQCENAPCVKACPVKATWKSEDGITLIDQNRCIGCRMCMAACPYGARYFNWNEPPETPATLPEPRPEWPVPQQQGTVGKCVMCVHNLRYGKLPACVEACSMEALYVGDFNADLATNGREVVELSKYMKDNDVVRYKEELGTHPRVYYVLGHGQDLDY